MNWKFWKKKSSSKPEPQPTVSVTEHRCFVKEIIKDLEPSEWDNWSEKVNSYVQHKHRTYTLYVGDFQYYTGQYYVSLSNINELNFTTLERAAVSEAYTKMVNYRREKEQKLRQNEEEKLLKNMFPNCYPN